MAISVFPAPAAASGAAAFAATITELGTVFEHEQTFAPGVYSLTVNPTTTNVRATFVSGSNILLTVDTTSGSVAFALASPATGVFVTASAGGTVGAVVSIQKTADPLVSDDIGGGTLDTITTTGTYNQTGLLAVLAFGGGEYGGTGNSTSNGPYLGGGGGRAGFINGGIIQTNEATTITIGTGGIAPNLNVAPVASTGSSFGNVITTNTASNLFPNAPAGNAQYTGAVGTATPLYRSWTGNQTTGSGGGGSAANQYTHVGKAGGGSGIGTGGKSGYNSVRGGNATGRAAGGGGGMGKFSFGTSEHQLGGNGSAGVVYVLRGF
jgi:hypothetical protein